MPPKHFPAIDDLDEVIKEKKLKEIKGIGEAIAGKIEEYVETGRMTYFEELKQACS